MRWPQPCAQQMIAREDVQRQIAVMAIVAVKEASFLFAVEWIVAGIQIEHHLRRRSGGPTGSRPSPLPAHQTGRADFRHPAFRLVSSLSTRRSAKVDVTEAQNAQ